MMASHRTSTTAKYTRDVRYENGILRVSVKGNPCSKESSSKDGMSMRDNRNRNDAVSYDSLTAFWKARKENLEIFGSALIESSAKNGGEGLTHEFDKERLQEEIQAFSLSEKSKTKMLELEAENAELKTLLSSQHQSLLKLRHEWKVAVEKEVRVKRNEEAFPSTNNKNSASACFGNEAISQWIAWLTDCIASENTSLCGLSSEFEDDCVPLLDGLVKVKPPPPLPEQLVEVEKLGPLARKLERSIACFVANCQRREEIRTAQYQKQVHDGWISMANGRRKMLLLSTPPYERCAKR